MHAVLIYFTVFDRKGDLRKLGEHSEKCGKPHPEHRSRSAREDRAGNAGNVSCSDRACQSSRHRLEGGQVLTVVPAASGKKRADRVTHTESELGQLYAACADSQINAGTHQQDQHDRSPGEIVDDRIDLFNSGN